MLVRAPATTGLLPKMILQATIKQNALKIAKKNESVVISAKKDVSNVKMVIKMIVQK